MDNLWKRLWRGVRKCCGKVARKVVGKGCLACSGCSVLWEIVRFCGKLFGFSELVRVGCGKKVSDGFEDESIEFTISTHPTIITTNIFKKKVFNNKEVIWS